MTLSVRTIPPGPGYWPEVARQLALAGPEMSRIRVLVPTYVHIVHLRRALAGCLGPSFIPPEIRTLADWLDQLRPSRAELKPSSPGERLLGLYAQLRELGWLKKLFDARRNADLLPLARTLLTLSDELTAALLPSAIAQPDAIEDRWRAALEQLSPQAAALLSNESQLVWNIWHAQRDEHDPGLLRHAALRRLAAGADRPLFWCGPYEPDAIESDFLNAHAQQQPVTVLRLAWSPGVLPAVWQSCWPELSKHDTPVSEATPAFDLRLYPARSLEHEAQSAAQTIISWLQQGMNKILLVPQDRVVARRVRALLERAQIVVSDETGWKLSTTRAAAVMASWMDLVASQGQPLALLDFVKSPFLFHDPDIEARRRLEIERALTRAEVPADWQGLKTAVEAMPEAKRLIDIMVREAERHTGRKAIPDWVTVMLNTFDALGMQQAMKHDVAGSQLIAMLELLASECGAIVATFSLAEWRALLNLQLEQTVFVAPKIDQRVMMVPLNGVPLREFDAAIIVGADAAHLPSPPSETLFFANSVRRELGLATREQRAQQQLQDFATLLLSCPQVVLSWQSQQEGEANPVSPWIQRLELELKKRHQQEQLNEHHNEHHNETSKRQQPAKFARHILPEHEIIIDNIELTEQITSMPAPSASHLLPAYISASGYNSLVACPYQFFATRMLKLGVPDELNELPEKRDYGNWLHKILFQYHHSLTEQNTPLEQRAGLLQKISDEVFDQVLQQHPAALGYAARWKKQMPAYLVWANAHQEAGWIFEFGEKSLEQTLQWEGGSVTLRGRIDRVDRNAQGEQLVLDYKTSDKYRLKKKLTEREDHQLVFYGLLLDEAPSSAAYVAIDADKPEALAAEPYAQWRDMLALQLKSDFKQIAAGSPLPAAGVGSACLWCDVRGLCRKGVW